MTKKTRRSFFKQVGAALAAGTFSDTLSSHAENNETTHGTQRKIHGRKASFYGSGTRSDPKPSRNLRALDDIYGKDVWNYFCAMPDTSLRGTTVLVVNELNKKAAILVVADYGPNQRSHPDRVIDVSDYSARRGGLDFHANGLTPVSVYIFERDEKPKLGPMKKYEVREKEVVLEYN